MKKLLLVVMAALLLLGTALPAQAAQVPLTLTPYKVGFDLGTDTEEVLEVVAHTQAVSVLRSQLDSHLTFDVTLVTDIPAQEDLDYNTGYFDIYDFADVQERKSVVTREVDGVEYFAWRMTIPTTSLVDLAVGGETRYAFVFSAVTKALGDDLYTLAMPYTLVLHLVDDMADVESSATLGMNETFLIGQDVYVIGVRESLNVRVLPHDKTASIGRVLLGEKVRLLDWDTSGDWVKIEFRDGTLEGFVPFKNIAHEPE